MTSGVYPRTEEMIRRRMGRKHSKETRKNISEAGKGNTYRLGCKCSKETRNKMSLAKQNMSDETKNKISLAHKGEKNYMFGKHHSKETRKKLSESHKDFYKTLEGQKRKNKLSEAHKGKPSPMMGKHHSEESRNKMSESHKGKPNPLKGKKLSEEHKRKLRENHVGMKGKHLSKETKNKISKANKGKMSEARKKFLDSLSEEEKHNRLKNSMFKAGKTNVPNKKEAELFKMIESLGFHFNPRILYISNHYPDFYHKTLNLIIEYDGVGGHRPDINPLLPKNKPELDDLRDNKYRKAGYKVLRILPKDLKKGQEFIQNKVNTWMNISI